MISCFFFQHDVSSDIMPACFHGTEKILTSESLDVLLPIKRSGNNYSLHSAKEKMDNNLTKHGGSEFYSGERSVLLQSISNMMNMEHQECGEMRSMRGRKYEGGSSGCKDMKLELDKNTTPILHNTVLKNDRFNDSIAASEKVTIDSASFPSCETNKLHYMDINQKEMQILTRPSDANFQKVAEKSKSRTYPCYKINSYFESETDILNTLKFPAGCELHEALGPAFLKGSKYFNGEEQVNQDSKPMDIPDDINSSQLTYECLPEHLLEAMVANFFHSNNDVNSGESFCTSMNQDASIHQVRANNANGCSISESCLIREDKNNCLSSSSVEPFERSAEPAKNSKRRGRVGERCRPRPRDRQLIQDRIKELRELVPSGSKCSIDSLLERAIKHMLFLQSITKHADTKTMLQHMKIDALGSSSYEQGSSWILEVGGHLKVHSILVENLSKKGQMFVEMLCEESSHFLEIAEAIRSLDLTILKGSTRSHGEKIWISFVVEVGSKLRSNCVFLNPCPNPVKVNQLSM
ncbi:hypothetical protein PIB30_076730 [Stylosanthes scabra]|uniref:BHLH domain-containing protein n=1 Tax=Stylosanthes scabra TaxID=79078 RepID=A0ABU6XQK4_9FABA|nr:hypothetical protein [Stylosanthes scabra]